MLSSCGVSISVCETVWKQILLPHFCIASTASVMPMNRGIQGAGGSVEAKNDENCYEETTVVLIV